jgi:hypothetical protein
MTGKQPEALRLADILENKIPSIKCLEVSAKELRRLHEVNQDLVGALEHCVNALSDYVQTIEKEKGATLNYGHSVIRMSLAALAKTRRIK